MAIKTVAVIGASGNVGASIVAALLANHFTVTAITRESSTSSLPAGVAVRKADFSSLKSLVSAFEGHDAVVAAVATSVALGSQNILADAALAAGVKRFIPSEFGTNTRNLGGEVLGTMLQGKTDAVNYLMKLSEKNPAFTWTGVGTSLFFDWGLDHGTFGLSLEKKSMTIFDSGNEPVSTSSLPFIGRSVAAILEHETKTANKYVDVIEFNITQNQLLKVVEDETGIKFATTSVKTEDLERLGHEKMKKHDHSSFIDFLMVYNYRDGGDHAIREDKTANKLLGLPASDLTQVVKAHLESKVY